MARQRRANPPLTWRQSRIDGASGTPAGQRGRRARKDPTGRRLRSMDAVLLDPQRLYDATLCSPDEFDYMLHLYEGWVERNGQMHLFRSDDAGGPAGRYTVHPRHALLMLLADKRANVQMEMLADLFGTDIDNLSTYLAMTDEALTEVLSDTAEGVAGGPGETGLDASAANLAGFDMQVPTISLLDTIRPRTAKNYPGLLPSKRASGSTRPEDVEAAGRRVEDARAARVTLSVEERLKQYRRVTDPYTGYPGLGTEIAVIIGLENFHLAWDQIRRENASLLRTLAKKRVGWGAT